MAKGKIVVLSQYLFDEQMKDWGLNSQNVENTKDTAFISIIGTKECLEYYLDEADTKHYFMNNSKNVLNLDFDDVSTDVIYDGHTFKTMSMKQAEKAVDFIEDMVNDGRTTFYIHCRAGMSRSRAFGEFIYRTFGNDFDIEYEDRNDYTTILNQGVLRRLNHAYWKKHKMECYTNGEDYEDDLVHPEIREIHWRR
jgi:hypothetical protein